MFNFVKEKSPLLIMLVGAFCLFIVNVVAKHIFDSVEFSDFIIFMLVISLLSTLSVLGFENVLLRKANVESDMPVIDQRYIYYSMMMVLLCSSAYFAIVTTLYDFSNITIISHVIFLISFSISSVLSVFLRLKENYFTSTLVINLWKLFLLILFCYFYLSETSINTDLYFIPPLVFFVILIIIAYSSKAVVKFERDENLCLKNIVYIHFGFLLGLLFFSGINSYDKFILQKTLSPDVFSEYAYFLSIILYPVSIIAAFIGYKELVEVKKNGYSSLDKNLLSIFLKTIVFFSLYSLFVFSISDLIKMNFYFELWIIVFLFVCIRMPYSLLSAVIGAKSESGFLISINVAFLILLILFSFIVFYYQSFYVSTSIIAFAFFARNIIYYVKAKKFLKGSS